MTDRRDLYSIFELEPSCTPAELHLAYLDLVKVWHPDRFQGEHNSRLRQKAEERLKAINEAYTVLTEASRESVGGASTDTDDSASSVNDSDHGSRGQSYPGAESAEHTSEEGEPIGKEGQGEEEEEEEEEGEAKGEEEEGEEEPPEGADSASGYIYILGNPAIPHLVKIGRTKHDPETRAYQVSAAPGVPLPFELIAYFVTSDAPRGEKRVHAALSAWRVNPRREFFAFTAAEARRFVADVLSTEYMTPEPRSPEPPPPPQPQRPPPAPPPAPRYQPAASSAASRSYVHTWQPTYPPAESPRRNHGVVLFCILLAVLITGGWLLLGPDVYSPSTSTDTAQRVEAPAHPPDLSTPPASSASAVLSPAPVQDHAEEAENRAAPLPTHATTVPVLVEKPTTVPALAFLEITVVPPAHRVWLMIYMDRKTVPGLAPTLLRDITFRTTLSSIPVGEHEIWIWLNPAKRGDPSPDRAISTLRFEPGSRVRLRVGYDPAVRRIALDIAQ
jgi:hypothetical protein